MNMTTFEQKINNLGKRWSQVGAEQTNRGLNNFAGGEIGRYCEGTFDGYAGMIVHSTGKVLTELCDGKPFSAVIMTGGAMSGIILGIAHPGAWVGAGLKLKKLLRK